MITTEALARLENFNAVHDAQEIALRDLLRSWEQSRRDRKISLVFGPAGVGKDRLIALAIRDITAEARGCKVIEVEAAPEVGRAAFSMKTFLALLLVGLDDPDPARHSLTDEERLREVERFADGKTGSALLFAVRERLKAFRPPAVVINEANYLVHGDARRSPTNARIQSNTRSLTWLADTTGVPIILLGTYPTLRLPKAGADVNRRMRLIHYPRYGDAAQSLEHFGRATHRFGRFLVEHGMASADLSLRSAPVLSAIYDSTFGLVGVLRDLIVLAAQNARDARRLVTLDDIHAARPAVLADPADFEAKLIEGEQEAVLSGHGNRYPFRKRSVPPETSQRRDGDRRRQPARTTPVGEQRLGRNKCFGVLDAPTSA